MSATYFQTDEGYIAVTNEHPAGMKGVALVGRDDAGEGIFMVAKLRTLPQVALADVPPEWVEALGYDKPPAPEPVEELILLDEEGENLVAFMAFPEAERIVRNPVDPARWAWELGLVLGGAAVLALLFFAK